MGWSRESRGSGSGAVESGGRGWFGGSRWFVVVDRRERAELCSGMGESVFLVLGRGVTDIQLLFRASSTRRHWEVDHFEGGLGGKLRK